MTAPVDPAVVRRWVRYVVVGAMLWSLALAIAVFVFARDEAEAARITPRLVAITAGIFVVNHVLRFIRWHLMLAAEGHWVPWARGFAIFMAGLALLPTPGKAGVAARSLLLLPEGVPVHVSIAAYFAERLLDLVGLVMLASVLLGAGAEGHRLLVALAIGVAGVAFIVAAPAILRFVRARLTSPVLVQGVDWTSRCFVDAREMLAAWRLPLFILLGMGANASAGLLLWASLTDAPHGVDLVHAVGILAVSHLSGSLSMLPGGLGGFELAMLAQLSAAGVASLDALTALSAVRVVTLWGGVAAGMPLLWLGLRRLRRAEARA
jgi:glycosyltransferase 2 family protein